MPRLAAVCRHIRSKNAGPFWVTVDLFFDGPDNFARYHAAPALRQERFAQLYGCDPTMVRAFSVPSLSVLKISYPRQQPQGWAGERDMHSGQQFVRLLDVDLDEVAGAAA